MVLPVLISDVLNVGLKILDLGEVEVSAKEVGVLEKPCFSLHGIYGILDCGSSKAANLLKVDQVDLRGLAEGDDLAFPWIFS